MKAFQLLPALALLLVACTPSTIARQASKAAVDEGAEQLTKEGTQDELKAAAEDPKIQAATEDMSEQIAEGVLKALESDRAKTQLTAMTRAVTQAAVQQLVAALGADQTRANLVMITEGVTSAALKQAGDSLQTDLRPALRTILQEDVTSAITSALRDTMTQPALGQAAQTVGYNLSVGANHGLGAAWSDDDGIMGQARGLPSVGRTWLWLGLSMMSLLTVMFVSGAVMMVARARQARSEVSRLESATLLLATAMRERQQTEQTDEIVALVQSALETRVERSGTHRILDALGLRKSG